jgi:hypothetical protein
MPDRKAVVDDSNNVQNVIIADAEYSHPTDTIIDATDKAVGPGDRYDPETDSFITPAMRIDAPATLPNDGTEAQIVISTTSTDTQTVSLQIADYTTTVSVDPNAEHVETVSTTQTAGATITVTAETQTDIRSDTATIAVVNS